MRNDNELRNHNHIHHDKYAMEMSDEYMDSSTINKSKLKDTSKNKKVANATFLFLFIKLDQSFSHVMELGPPIFFSYLNVAKLHLPALFFI